MITTGTAPFEMIENGAAVMCYPVTFDGRKVTVHTPDGPRTRMRRNCRGYATAAVLRAMGVQAEAFADSNGVLEIG